VIDSIVKELTDIAERKSIAAANLTRLQEAKGE
jgi:hypothetical protein